MDKLNRMHWFKFDPMLWLTGRIQRQPVEVQMAFLRLMCIYWSEGCLMTFERAELEAGEDECQRLLKAKIIKEKDGMLRISFMDDLFLETAEKSKKAREAIEKRWNNRNTDVSKNDTNESKTDTNVLQTYNERNTEKKRTEKNRKEKTTTNTDDVVVDGYFSHYQTKIETEKEVKPADIDNAKYLNELLTDEMWQGSTCVAYKLPNKRLKDYLVSFYEHLVTVAKQHPNTTQFRRHFVNWLQTQISNAKEPAIKYEP
jgi:HD superfamily phosphohydrolase